jgi:hypothetical protein
MKTWFHEVFNLDPTKLKIRKPTSEEISLVESKSIPGIVDGKAILGVIQGPHFVAGGSTSLNERYYEPEFWPYILETESVKNRVDLKKMGGQFGHKSRPVEDEDYNKGEVSHYVNKIFIDPETNLGHVESFILGTPAGKNLWVYFESGMGIQASSRGAGEYKEGATTEEGLPIVEKESFYLETFDYVINPGFPETSPKLAENLTGSENMQLEKTLNVLTENNTRLQKSLDESEKDNKGIKSENITLKEQVKALEEKAKRYSFLENVDEKTLTSIQNLKESDWTKINGTELEEYRKLGPLEQFKTTLPKVKNILEVCKKIGGSPNAIEQTLARTSERLKELSAFKKVGKDPATLKKAIEAARQVTETMKKSKENEQKLKLKEAIKKYSTTYDLEIEEVRQVFVDVKYDEKAAKRVLEKMGNKTNTEPKKPVGESRFSRLSSGTIAERIILGSQ